MATTYRDPAERSGYLRLFYRDWRPTGLGRLVNGALARLSGLRLTPRALIALQVKGRRSGRLRTNVLVVARHDGQRYLVSMLGEGSEWVRNVRAAGGEAFVKRGRSRPVKLIEVPVSERGPILKTYCHRRHERASPPPSAPQRADLGVRRRRRALPRVPHRPGVAGIPTSLESV